MNTSLRFHPPAHSVPDPGFVAALDDELAPFMKVFTDPSAALRGIFGWLEDLRSRLTPMIDEAAGVDVYQIADELVGQLQQITGDGPPAIATLNTLLSAWEEIQDLFVRHEQTIQERAREVAASFEAIGNERDLVAFTQFMQSKAADKTAYWTEMFGDDAPAMLAFEERMEAAKDKFGPLIESVLDMNDAAGDLGLEHRVWASEDELDAHMSSLEQALSGR